jgi:DNA-binding transcriptional ArsR family regulator
MKTILWWLIAGSKGGINRAKIIKELHDRPYNANQITERLGLDYKTVRHHLKVLSENGIIESNSGEKYGTMYPDIRGPDHRKHTWYSFERRTREPGIRDQYLCPRYRSIHRSDDSLYSGRSVVELFLLQQEGDVGVVQKPFRP